MADGSKKPRVKLRTDVFSNNSMFLIEIENQPGLHERKKAVASIVKDLLGCKLIVMQLEIRYPSLGHKKNLHG